MKKPRFRCESFLLCCSYKALNPVIIFSSVYMQTRQKLHSPTMSFSTRTALQLQSTI